MFCGVESKKPAEGSPSDCKKIQNYIYRAADKVGEGSFSQVFHGVDTNDGSRVAIKVVKYSSLSSRVAEGLLKNEVSILKELDHPNVLKCLDIFSSKNNCYIICELCENGDLEKLVGRHKKFEEQDIGKIVYDVYQGLKYLNQQGIVHRDFKLANVFLDSNNTAKIADFGFAVKMRKPFKDINIGSPIYMSPEGMLLHEYGPKTEVWAFGIMIYELLHGDTPLSYCRLERELQEKIMLPPQFRAGISPDCRAFIDFCLTVDPKHRPTIQDLANTPYLSKLIYSQSKATNSIRPFLKEKTLDLASTHHSNNSIQQFPSPQLVGALNSLKTYEDTLSVLQYCRLIHKTTQLTPSSLLSQWLLYLCSMLQKVKLQEGDRERNERLQSTIQSYFNKYRKEHAPMHELNGRPYINEVISELERLLPRAEQPPNRKQGRTAGHLSMLLQETHCLKKAVESEEGRMQYFSRFSQSGSYLEGMKLERSVQQNPFVVLRN